jgi:hypothetical protein
MTDQPDEPYRKNLVRPWMLGLTAAGALGSLDLTILAGKNNTSILLMALFCGWVLSPFVALFAGIWRSKILNNRTQFYLAALVVVITALSLTGYAGLFDRPGMKHAFVFLVIPVICWILLLVFYFIFRKKKTV